MKTTNNERHPASVPDKEVQQMVQNLQRQCAEWNRNVKRAAATIKTMAIMVVCGLTYSVLPNLGCQYIEGHNAHRPILVCNQLTNTLQQCYAMV